MMEFAVDLPEPLPSGLIEAEEEHEYEVYDDGTVKTEYTLEKAGGNAVKQIESVIGRLNGRTHEFVEGSDYELSGDNERIVWLNADRPDDNTRFTVVYLTESILTRYSAAGEEELSEAEQAVIDSINAKLIDEATGNDLDEIGKLFGPVVGKRRGRNDEVYRIYLKSVVQSFVSRGTRAGIRTAVGAAIGIDPSKIEIDENFQESSYEVVLPPISAHAASTIEDIAEVADPSGIEQELTRYILPVEEIGIDDFAGTAPRHPFYDEAGSSDAFTVNPGTHSTADEGGVDDSVTVDPDTTLVSDTGGIDDVVATDITVIYWDSGNWDSMQWS